MVQDSAAVWRRLLAVVAESQQALTGRQVASAAGVSPTTATRGLRALEEQQLVTSWVKGRSTLWRATAGASDALDEVGPPAVRRRALFLTALPLETAALKSQLPDGQILRESNGSRTFATTVVGERIAWDIRILEVGMGNAASAAVAARSLDGFVPDLLVFVGVAGGLKAGQRHGEVVIVNRAYNAVAGKETTTADGMPTFASRPVSERIPLALEALASQVAATMRLPAGISVGAVACTEAVLGTAQGLIYQRIRSALNDCAIVDMESYGVYVGARQLGVPALSIRGISDMVDDKTPRADELQQPAAAKNAAKVAIQLLRDADPDDVQSSSDQRPEYVDPGTDGRPARLTVLEHDTLPANAQPWHSQLLPHDPGRAESARLELLGWRTGAIATHASRIVDRPPVWLRTDDTGDAWAMVGAVAHAADAGVASRAYMKAAHRAQEAGAHDVAGLHLIQAALAIRPAAGVGDEAHSRVVMAQLASLDLALAPSATAFRAFIIGSAKEGEDWTYKLDVAAEALNFFGVAPVKAGLSGHPRDHADQASGSDDEPTRAPIASMLPKTVRDALVGRILLSVVAVLIYEQRGLDALQAADLALKLLPDSGAAKVRRAQALLTVLHTTGGREGLGPASEVLAEVERLATAARTAQIEWDANSAEALALAGRALTEAGDPRGALRRLSPPPAGTATPREAGSVEVARIVVGAALMVGDHDLALKAAEQLETTGEGLIMKANALERAPGMRNEARRAYGEALAERGTSASVLERALLGLARLGEPLHNLGITARQPAARPTSHSAEASGETAASKPSSRKQSLGRALDELRSVNPRMADIVVGQAALIGGDAEQALALGRRHRDHEQGVELTADAYEALGEPAKATDTLWAFGTGRGIVAMQLEALMRAGQQGDFDRVTRFSEAVIRDYAGEPKRIARRARIRAAGLTNDWPTVDAQARMLITEAEPPSEGQLTDSELASLRWTRVEALYRMRQPQLAYEVLRKPTPLPVMARDEALLALATLYLLVEKSVSLSAETADFVLTIASSWIDDEEVCRNAIGVFLLGRIDLDLGQISRARQVTERYFETHKEDAQIRQITMEGEIDEDTGEAPAGYFEPLYEELKRGADARDEMLRKLDIEVWRGRVPWAMAVDVLNRTYAGSLIQGAAGAHVVTTPSAPAPHAYGIEAATHALETGSVVIDTTALVLGPKFGHSRRDLLSLFDRIHLPEALREDMFRARAELARRSDTTIGWDLKADRPRIDIADAVDVERWAREADELCECLALLVIQSADRTVKDLPGLHAVDLADRLNTTLWADDAALRLIASERAVRSFTTLDLLEAQRQRGDSLVVSTFDEIAAVGRTARIVDLPLPTPWWRLAMADSWNAAAGTALAISRPGAWQDPVASFEEFRCIIDVLGRQPTDVATVETVASWTAAAARGLAWGTPPGARSKMVSNLLTWVLLQREPAISAERIAYERVQVPLDSTPDRGRLLNMAFAIMRDLGASAYPEADGIRELTSTLAAAVRSVADAPTTMRLMLDALRAIEDQSVQQHAIKAILTFPPIPEPDANA